MGAANAPGARTHIEDDLTARLIVGGADMVLGYHAPRDAPGARI
ncbi:hypothetical protein [Streptomyces sp. NPDC020489]